MASAQSALCLLLVAVLVPFTCAQELPPVEERVDLFVHENLSDWTVLEEGMVEKKSVKIDPKVTLLEEFRMPDGRAKWRDPEKNEMLQSRPNASSYRGPIFVYTQGYSTKVVYQFPNAAERRLPPVADTTVKDPAARIVEFFDGFHIAVAAGARVLAEVPHPPGPPYFLDVHSHHSSWTLPPGDLFIYRGGLEFVHQAGAPGLPPPEQVGGVGGEKPRKKKRRSADKTEL